MSEYRYSVEGKEYVYYLHPCKGKLNITTSLEIDVGDIQISILDDQVTINSLYPLRYIDSTKKLNHEIDPVALKGSTLINMIISYARHIDANSIYLVDASNLTPCYVFCEGSTYYGKFGFQPLGTDMDKFNHALMETKKLTKNDILTLVRNVKSGKWISKTENTLVSQLYSLVSMKGINDTREKIGLSRCYDPIPFHTRLGDLFKPKDLRMFTYDDNYYRVLLKTLHQFYCEYTELLDTDDHEIIKDKDVLHETEYRVNGSTLSNFSLQLDYGDKIPMDIITKKILWLRPGEISWKSIELIYSRCRFILNL
jgi:hypothetical protein